MIAFDSNVVIRLLVEDDETQAKRSRQILGDAVEKGESVFITDIVLCELEWVLEAAYKVPRARILTAIQMLAADDRFCFEDASRVAQALQFYQRGKGDLSDYLLGLVATQTGSETTYTFDRGLRGERPFTVIDG